MPDDTVFTLRLESDLGGQIMAEAEAARQPASEILRELVAAYVMRQRLAREHAAWFRSEVEQGLREADDPAVARLAGDEVMSSWHRQRAALLKHVGESDARTPGDASKARGS